MKDEDRKTRHRIDITITELVDMALPDEGGALVSVAHNRAIRDAETSEDTPEDLHAEDLLDILANLTAGTVLNSSFSPSHKIQAALMLGKTIVTLVAKGLSGLDSDPEGLTDDLSEDQKASLALSMASPSFKPPAS